MLPLLPYVNKRSGYQPLSCSYDPTVSFLPVSAVTSILNALLDICIQVILPERTLFENYYARSSSSPLPISVQTW